MFIFIMLIWAILIISSFILFGRLVRWEYFHYRANWIKDGKPTGLLWAPPELKTIGFREMFGWHKDDMDCNEYTQMRQDSNWIGKNKNKKFIEMRKSSTATKKLILDWLFSTPVWTSGDWHARFLLYCWRFLTLIGIGFWPLLILLAEILD
jgi:hypothetical protein